MLGTDYLGTASQYLDTNRRFPTDLTFFLFFHARQVYPYPDEAADMPEALSRLEEFLASSGVH